MSVNEWWWRWNKTQNSRHTPVVVVVVVDVDGIVVVVVVFGDVVVLVDTLSNKIHCYWCISCKIKNYSCLYRLLIWAMHACCLLLATITAIILSYYIEISFKMYSFDSWQHTVEIPLSVIETNQANTYSWHTWTAPPGGVRGTMSLSLCPPHFFSIYPAGGKNSNSTSHSGVSRPACSQNALFQTFPAEIDGIRSGYYHTKNALKPTYSHLRSQNFLGVKPPDPACTPQRAHSNPPYKYV